MPLPIDARSFRGYFPRPDIQRDLRSIGWNLPARLFHCLSLVEPASNAVELLICRHFSADIEPAGLIAPCSPDIEIWPSLVLSWCRALDDQFVVAPHGAVSPAQRPRARFEIVGYVSAGGQEIEVLAVPLSSNQSRGI
jgi:hypothetical protein